MSHTNSRFGTRFGMSRFSISRFSMFRSMLCGVAAYVLLLAGLNAVGLVGPDEPRYADVARAMYGSGDYVTPRLFGEPWFEKPPLYYWLAAAAFHLGISERTARLPSALAALLFLGFWYWFAQRYYSPRAAQWSCLMLATSLGWIGFARAAAMDMLLTCTLSAALAFLAAWWWPAMPGEPEHPRNPPWALYGFYITLALATLAKGPLALGLAGLVVAGYAVHRTDWRAISRMLITPAAGVFALIALPWYVLCYARNGWPFIEEFFIRHNLQRFTSGEIIGHPQPFWFYIPVLPAAIFPWTPLLLLAVWAKSRNGSRDGWRQVLKNPRQLYLLYWIALPFVFFSLAENKLPGYLLPLLPPLTLLLADTLAGAGEFAPQNPSEAAQDVPADFRPKPSWFWKAGMALAALSLLIVPLFSWVLPQALATGLGSALARAGDTGLWIAIARSGVPPAVWSMVLALIAVALLLLWKDRLLEAGGVIGLGVCGCLLVLLIYQSPAINAVASSRNVAGRAALLGINPRDLGVLYLHRAQVFGLGFYLGRGLAPWDPDQPGSDPAFVAARDDFHIDEMRPGARSLAIFPGQQLRLWALAPDPAQQAQPAADREAATK